MNRSEFIAKQKAQTAQAVRDEIPVQTRWGTVTKVTGTLCNVQLSSGIEMEDVLLNALDSGVYAEPELQSKALVGIIEGLPGEAYLIQAEKVARYVIDVSSKVKIEANGVNMLAVMQSFIRAIRALILQTNQGPTLQPIVNDADFAAVLEDINKMLE